MDEPQCEIYDPFDSLSPSERSETMSKALRRAEERLSGDNQRKLKRVLDIIAKTDGDDELHLNILATHLDKHSSETVYTRTHLLRLLELAVRTNAPRELLGDSAVDNLRLPAEYCEFARQCGGFSSADFDRQVFLCEFSTQMYCPEKLAEPLDKIEQSSGASYEYYVAAGWKVGENYDNCVIYYALAQHVEEPDEFWRWRIFVNNWSIHECQGPFDDIFSFMDWYCDRYNQVPWNCVESGMERTHEKCKAALDEARRDLETREAHSH